ncbi:hypothetical protein FOZ63_000426, partial [Perkinsus olseni]
VCGCSNGGDSSNLIGGGTLTANCEGLTLKGLVDTGATDALISRCMFRKLCDAGGDSIKLCPSTATVQLANGSREQVKGTVDLPLCFANGVLLSQKVYVVEGLRPDVIWGLKLLGRIGAQININTTPEGVRVSTSLQRQSTPVVSAVGAEVSNLGKAELNQIVVRRAGDDYAVEDVPVIEAGQSPLTSPVETRRSVSFSEPSCDQICFDWRPVPSSVGYYYRVREAQKDDVIDLPDQKFICELKWTRPPTSPTRKTVDYSSSVASRLGEAEKKAFFDEISSYLSQSWWYRSDGAPADSAPIVVFPLASRTGQMKTTRVRPVCDCRQTNRQLGNASYLGKDVMNLLTEIQLAYDELGRRGVDDVALGCLDVSRAFYRVHLGKHDGKQCRVELLCCGESYYSCRLVFGLSIGPSGLEVFMKRLLQLARSAGVLDGVHVYIYLDDWTLVGARSKVEAAMAYIRALARQHGFPFPVEKGALLSSRSSNDTWVRHLGVWWRFFGGRLTLSCPSIEVEPLKERYSKRNLFEMVGRWYDPARLHADWRFASDLCRIIGGRWNCPWDQQKVLTEAESKVVSTALGMVCISGRSHSHTLPWNETPVLILRSDASSSGYGWAVSLQGCPAKLLTRARIWKPNQRGWHVNRQEAFAVIEGLLAVADLDLKAYGIEKVIIETDSRVACCWLKDGTYRAVTRSQEKAAIERLLMLACDAQVRLDIPVLVRHIPAAENEYADSLSRWVEKYKLPEAELFKNGKHVSGGDIIGLCEVGVTEKIETLRDAQLCDPYLLSLITDCESQPSGQVVRDGSLFMIESRDGHRVLVKVVRTPGLSQEEYRRVL